MAEYAGGTFESGREILIRCSPDLAEMLRQPGGYRSSVPVTFWLEGDVLHVQELHNDGCPSPEGEGA